MLTGLHMLDGLHDLSLRMQLTVGVMCAASDAGDGRSQNNIVPLVPGAPRCSFYSSCASSVLRSLPV